MNNLPDPKKYYQILGADCTTDSAALKALYHQKAKFWHPDRNPSPEAMENFQLISVAYDILKDEKSRLYYNLLSLVYSEKDFPDMNTIIPFLNSNKKLDLNLRSITATKVVGKIYKSVETNESHLLTFAQAKSFLFKTALKNWLFGWWGLGSIRKNWRALSANALVFESNKKNNLRLFIHNMIALKEENKPAYAYLLAKLAKNYTSSNSENDLIDEFIKQTKMQSDQHLPEWNYQKLRSVQFFVPAIIGFFLFVGVCGAIFSQPYFYHAKKEINYNQVVKGMFGDTFDDVVVGKIVNLPVDIDDNNMLYHLRRETAVKYGPSDKFDILATLKKGHTVRVSGYTPDKVWYRIMLDNGENGFVRVENLAKGIGNSIPQNSKIIRQ